MVFTQMSEESKEGALIACVGFLYFLLAKKLKVTPRLSRFLFGKKPYLTDSSDA